MANEALKKEIHVLVEDFVKNEQKPKSERDVCRIYLEPLFEKLGWHLRELSEVKEQVNQPDGRPDYIFYLNGSIAFFLEAKKIQELTEKDLKQAVNYARSKNKRWAVLSNFKETIILLGDIKETSIIKHVFRRISYTELESHIDDLLLLSNESFRMGAIEKKAQDEGRIKKVVKIDDELLNDILNWRQKLISSIKKNNSKEYSKEELEEIVQTILNRIIFMRTAEDRKHEAKPDNTIRAILNQYEKDKSINIKGRLNKLFKEYDEVYDSKLFTYDESNSQKRHECERVDIDNSTYYKILKETYDKDEIYTYQFNEIDADILGSMYEMYIGRIQSTRKEQGIYYTPKYIVTFIVKNTLGNILKTKKLFEAEKIKVLDMACGSGSFLQETFDVFDEYYKANDKNYAQSKLDSETKTARITRKTRILTNNIYGVDLDSKAVEITQLNLLLKAAENKHRLPSLQENIQCGNSLIEQSLSIESEAFDWHKRFKQVFIKNNGFDIVIGNPPYVFSRNFITEADKTYFSQNYQTFEYQPDLYILFLEQAVRRTRDEGLIGLIVPNAWFGNLRTIKIRKFILENTRILTVVYCPKETFGIGVETAIIILKKSKDHNRNSIGVFKYDKFAKLQVIGKVPQSSLLDGKEYRLNFRFTKNIRDIINKIESDTLPLSELSEITRGVNAYDKYRGQSQDIIINRKYHSDHKVDESYVPELKGKNVSRYSYSWNGQSWIKYGKWLAAPRDPKFFVGERLILRQIPSKRLVTTIITEDFCIDQTVFIAKLTSTKFSLKYVLGLVNSSLMAYYFKYKNEGTR